MARPVPRTSHRRQARSPPDPEMASDGRSRRRARSRFLSGERGEGGHLALLANVYLHYVLDLWAERWRRREPRATWSSYATPTTAIFGFEVRTDARRFLDAMRERLVAFLR